MKLTALKNELNYEVEKKMESVGIQTEGEVMLPESEMYLYRMFKLQMMKNMAMGSFFLPYSQPCAFSSPF